MRKVFVRISRLALVVAIVIPFIFFIESAHATGLVSETFDGTSTAASAWTSGNSACLTAATSSAANSVPACSGGPFDSPGSGVLRLTPNTGGQSGFVVYNTPVSTGNGLLINFDMYQYDGSGADGISFFLVNGTANPTVAGDSGGGLGYVNIAGGYVGVGFDVYGNFSNPSTAPGGPGAEPNTIAVRGDAASSYAYVTGVTAGGELADNGTNNRNNAELPVQISISNNNIMSVAVNYGSGYVTELSDINLNTINGADSLPATFKFGFAASTGGSTDIHEISNLTVDELGPEMTTAVTDSSNFEQGDSGSFHIVATNDSGGEPTQGTVTVTDTLPTGLIPTNASGSGWTCSISGQLVTCTTPGSGGNALQPGSSEPPITVTTDIAQNAPSSLQNTAATSTTNNNSTNSSGSDTVSIAANTTMATDESNAPNGGDSTGDGTPDIDQPNVTSLPDPVTNQYATVQTAGCVANSEVSVLPASDNATADPNYNYPAGMLNFTVGGCAVGGTATITEYYYGSYNPANFVMRKYNPSTDTYQTIPGAVFTSEVIGGGPVLKVVYQVTDGSAFDQDGVANGVIVDPSGPAIEVTPSATSVPDTGLAAQSAVGYYVAAGTGLALLVAATRKVKFWK